MDITNINYLSKIFVSSFSLKCAIDLDIAGCIQAYGGPIPLNELVRSIPIHPEKESMLGRLMALLVHQGVFGKTEAGYTLTPTSELLLKDGCNMGDYVRGGLMVEVFKGWDRMGEVLKDTGPITIFQKAFDGKQMWEVLDERPALGNLFNEAMAGHSRPVIRRLVASCPHIFDGLRSLVDVGGGNGTTVKIIAEAFPALRCTVFDLPHAAANVKSDSFDVIAGDMFEKIPPADAIFLKNVLHCLNDEDCIRILKRSKEAIESNKSNGGKVIVVDIIIDVENDDPKEVETGLIFDVMMMSCLGAKERNKQEWHELILASGFSSYKIGPKLGVESVIEIFP